MSWARLDDRYDDHPKTRSAWRRDPRAIGLHVMAITYCARHETDGLINAEWIEDHLPHAQVRARVLEVLLEVELFEKGPEKGTFLVHDYLEYNPSRAELADRRRSDSARKRRRNPDGIQPESEGSPNGLARARPQPRPVPSRKDY